LVQDLGKVAEVHETTDGVRIAIDSSLSHELSEGDSIAVNGVCLTAVGICARPPNERFGADVMRETLRRTSLGDIASGSTVLPLRAADRLGGHVVQGHVDGVGVVSHIADDGFAKVVTIEAGPDTLKYIVEKGSIAVDGISLTVARIDDAGFDVSLIPETIERTTLGSAEPGTTVNLEVDVLAKYVEKLIGARAAS
jgi:riboflavin synthase